MDSQLHQTISILEMYAKKHREIHCTGKTTLQAFTEYTPPCSSRCSRLKRTKEHLTVDVICESVSRGQGPPWEQARDSSSHSPHCLYILSHHCSHTTCGAKTSSMSLSHTAEAPSPLGCSMFCHSFMCCNMEELSYGLSEHLYPEKEYFV